MTNYLKSHCGTSRKRRRRPDEIVSRGQCEWLRQLGCAENKVGSLRSMKRWFALHSIRLLKKYERANHSRFPFTNVMGRVRGRLTLMPSQPADAVCWRAPARHH